MEIGHLPGRTLQRSNSIFESWAFAYVVGGKGTYQVNEGVIQTLKPGSVFFIRPEAIFHYGPAAGGTWDEYYIRFEGTRVHEWLNCQLLHSDNVAHIGIHDQLISKIETIFMLIESGLPANTDRAALLLESLIYEFHQLSVPQKATDKSEYVFAVLDDIANSPYDPFDAAVFAERHHIAVSTLRRLVRKHTGYSLHEYVHRLKLAEAKNLLLNTGQQVKDIAQKLGYDDTFYFSRLFKNFIGMSPTDFRTSI
jgi:AraC-like DNA-binding protein